MKAPSVRGRPQPPAPPPVREAADLTFDLAEELQNELDTQGRGCAGEPRHARPNDAKVRQLLAGIRRELAVIDRYLDGKARPS